MLFPPQFGDTVYMMAVGAAIRQGQVDEYIHNGKRYTRYEIWFQYVRFIPLTVIATSNNNILTDKGMTEIIDGQPCLSEKLSNDIYCHKRIVDKFFVMDWERSWRYPPDDEPFIMI